MRTLVMLLALGACSQQPEQERSEAGTAAPTATIASSQPVARQAALMSVPTDPAALKKLEAMGYNVHDDHMHAPGVAACPKMGDDPIM